MIYYIIIAAISVVVLALTPPYVMEQKDGANSKSLTLKMICACGYIAVGAIGIIKNNSENELFTKLMLGALIASWAGDLFLHLWKPKWIGAIGFLGFLSAHFFFIAAFYTEIKAINPDAQFFSVWEIIFILCFDCFFILFSIKTDMKLKGLMRIPIFIYATVITTMLCKAVEFGITAYRSGMATPVILAFTAIGAVCFVASDFTISILMFNPKHKKNIPLKMFNMITYFVAELLLAGILAIY